ncbi:MAG: hypothetical protein C0594_17265, partial [Marinilabiliales bacterium]
FTFFDVEDGLTDCDYDYLIIYDGEDTTGTVIGTYCNNNVPDFVTATNATGALTVVWYSDGSVTYSGWEATISQVCSNRPVADAGSDVNLCTAGDVNLGGSPSASGGTPSYTYQWTPATGLDSETIHNPVASVSNTTTYTLKVTDSEGCSSIPDEIQIDVNTPSDVFSSDFDETWYVCQGTFKDNGGDNDYLNYSNYTQSFFPCETGKMVKMTFTSFDLEYESICDYDWLKVYDGPDTNSTLLGTYCGTNSPGEVISTHSTGALTFVFSSDISLAYGGWEANVSCVCTPPVVDAGPDQISCPGGSVILGGSPTASGSVPPYTYLWTPAGNITDATVANPEATQSLTAIYYVSVTDSLGCVGTDSVSVTINDSISEYYTNTDAIYYTEQGNFYSSAGSTGGYENNENYEVTFMPCGDLYSVKLEFSTFDIEYNSTCSYDKLSIYNGKDSNAPLIGEYCGTSSPGLVQATNVDGAITIVFISDGSVNAPGWSATIGKEANCDNIGTIAQISSTGDGCSSGHADLSLATDIGTNPVQWQYSYDNINFTNLPDGNTSSVTGVVIHSTTFFRAVISVDGQNCYTNTVKYNSGNNYYVNDASLTGDGWCTAISDSHNDGLTPATPVAEVMDIFNNYDVGPCDTIFVDNGNYGDKIEITASDMGSSSGYIVILGASKENTVLNTTSGADNISVLGSGYLHFKNLKVVGDDLSRTNVFNYQSSDIIYENCDFVNSKEPGIMITGGDRTAGTESDDINVLSCSVLNTSPGDNAVLIQGDCKTILLDGNTIETRGTTSAEAVYVESTGKGAPVYVTIRNNTIVADDYGIYLNGTNNTISKTAIEGNIISIATTDQADGASIKMEYAGIDASNNIDIFNNELTGGKNGLYYGSTVNFTKVYNNIVHASQNGLIATSQPTGQNEVYFNTFYNSLYNLYFNDRTNPYWTVKNNIFANTSNDKVNGCVHVIGADAFAEIDNNLYFAYDEAKVAVFNGTMYATVAAWSAVNHQTQTGNGDENSLQGDPGFRDIANGDFRIYSTSPAYELVTDLAGITNDKNGTARQIPASAGALVALPEFMGIVST